MVLQDRANMLTGLGVGVGMMYLMDPERGRRRRALLRDQIAHAARVTGDAAGVISRDMAHRTSGTLAMLRGSFRREAVDDMVLADRVRARLGRVVSHPHAVAVAATDGIVALRGPILQHEVKQLLKAVAKIAGVRDVVNELDEHKEAAGVSLLQGGSTPAEQRPDILQRHWAPATRFMVGTGGVALATYGLSRRTLPGALVAASGIGLLARAALNVDMRRLTGIGGKRRAVDIQKTSISTRP